MGKALIEKLLRDTDIETIYVIVREKKGRTAHMRIEELFDDVIFDRLKSEKPKFRNKVEAVPGDCSITGLGLSIIDRQRLISKINIIFHVAATVNFNEQIKLAYRINVNGTRDVLNLAREIINLQSLIHVSTAYANCPKKEINEKIYDHPLRFSDMEAILEKMTKEESDLCTAKILGEWPNTYTFTKALAESLIKSRSNGLPIGIFRPSIIISTYREPMAGWIDNIYGPTGVAVGSVSGVLRVSPCDPQKLADMVPIDTCVAGIVAAAWDVSQKGGERNGENIPVYNYVSSPENPICWEEFIKLNFMHGVKYTPSNAIWCPFTLTATNSYIYWILKLFLHIIPATIVDLGCLLTGNKPKLLRLYKKVHKFTEILTFFCTREWTFTNKNTQALWNKLNKTDQKLFPLSITTVSWLSFFREYMRGVRMYLLKEPDSTLEAARLRNKRFTLVHRALGVALIFLMFNFGSWLFLRFYNILFR